MAEIVKDSPQDLDFLGQIYAYAERKAVGGVLIQRIKPVKGERALVIVAIGEMADALDAVLITNIITESEVAERARQLGF